LDREFEDLSWRKPKTKNYKRKKEDVEAYEERLEEAKEEKEELEGEGKRVCLAFEDEAHFLSGTNLRRCWCFRDQIWEIKLSWNRRSVFGTLTDKGEFLTRVYEKADSDSFIRYMKYLRTIFTARGVDVVYLILDNATYHGNRERRGSKKVRKYMEESNQWAAEHGSTVIKPVFLPPYSCELNPVEIVWNDWKSEKAGLFFREGELEPWLKRMGCMKKRVDWINLSAFLDEPHTLIEAP